MNLFDKLAAAEKEFFGSEFLSPVLKNMPVRARICGMILEFFVRPKNFQGWGVFRTEDRKYARFVRAPSMSEKRAYLDLLRKVPVVVCEQGEEIRAIAATKSDICIEGQIPVRLCEDVRLFDTIDVRFDGYNFWFDELSSFRSMKNAVTLRDQLSESTDPAKIDFPGLTPQERMAYGIAFDREIESKKDKKEERLRRAFERGGAVLRSYVERGQTYTVEYTVDGQRYRSVFDSETLSVTRGGAGICLTDHHTGRQGDSDFDVESLMSVIREGHQRNLIYRLNL